MAAPADTAQLAYGAAAAEYERVAALMAAHRGADARDTARHSLVMCRKLFRLAALTAPAAGETNASFDRLISSIGALLRQASAALDA